MTDSGTGATAPAVAADPGYSLGAEVGALLGEGSWSDDSAEPSAPASDAADAPSAERQATDGPSGSEGQTDAERAGEPPADAATPGPDASGTLTPNAEDDPLVGASPLSYVVNGESRQFDGIQVLKDNAGAIVTPEALQLLTRRLGERDHLFEKSQADHQRYSDLEKLTEWRVKDAQGKETVLAGAEGVRMRELASAMLRAEVQELRAMFDAPPHRWLAQDEQGNIVWNTDAFKDWQKGLDQSRKIAYHESNSRFGEMARPAPRSAEPLTPAAIAERAEPTIAAGAQHFGVTNLTDADKKTLAEQLPGYVRPATQDDVRQDPTLTAGEPFVTNGFWTLMKHLSSVRAEGAKQAATIAQTTNDAAKANAARLAAAARGARRPATPIQDTTRPPTPDQERATRSAALWDMAERAATRRRA